MKKCPDCAEEIQEEAVKCKYCGWDAREVERENLKQVYVERFAKFGRGIWNLIAIIFFLFASSYMAGIGFSFLDSDGWVRFLAIPVFLFAAFFFAILLWRLGTFRVVRYLYLLVRKTFKKSHKKETLLRTETLLRPERPLGPRRQIKQVVEEILALNPDFKFLSIHRDYFNYQGAGWPVELGYQVIHINREKIYFVQICAQGEGAKEIANHFPELLISVQNKLPEFEWTFDHWYSGKETFDNRISTKMDDSQAQLAASTFLKFIEISSQEVDELVNKIVTITEHVTSRPERADKGKRLKLENFEEWLRVREEANGSSEEELKLVNALHEAIKKEFPAATHDCHRDWSVFLNKRRFFSCFYIGKNFGKKGTGLGLTLHYRTDYRVPNIQGVESARGTKFQREKYSSIKYHAGYALVLKSFEAYENNKDSIMEAIRASADMTTDENYRKRLKIVYSAEESSFKTFDSNAHDTDDPSRVEELCEEYLSPDYKQS